VRKRILVLGAGSGASNNLIRSLRVGDRDLVIIGGQADRFVLKKSLADRTYLIAAREASDFAASVRRVVDAEAIDLVVPNSDADVRAVSAHRFRLGTRAFLPSADVIELCQDKYALTTFLHSHGVPTPETHPIPDVERVEAVFTQLVPRRRLWCRMRSGSGSMGALPVTTPDQARSWIAYWEQMRGIAPGLFTLSEYLPGRDFNVQGVWKDGQPAVLKMIERLAYYGGTHHPSGMSSTPALARTVFEPAVLDVAGTAVAALDARASGVFNVDLKENADGVPCVTEVNAGRFAMITNIYDLTGKHNTALIFVRLALDEPIEAAEPWDVAEDYYLVRDLDTEPGIFHADELSNRVEEIWPQ
jgi:carbamoyl-phosphate synthase large subunit